MRSHDSHTFRRAVAEAAGAKSSRDDITVDAFGALVRRRRLLTVGHSYVVVLNRRLAAEIAIAGRADWEKAASGWERTSWKPTGRHS